MRRLLAAALLVLLSAAGGYAACQDDLVATGEYANVVAASRTAAEKEVAILRVRLQQAEARLADTEKKLKAAAPTEPTQP